MGNEEGTRKPKGDGRIPEGIPTGRTPEGQKPSGSGQRAAQGPAILDGRECPGERRVKQEKVLERVYDRRRLQWAWQKVRRNAGAAGIDAMTVESFAEREQELLSLIHEKLKAGTYRFKPARRVLIPKPGSTKKRKLGIPVVMDRIVSQGIHQVFEEIFDGEFTSSNFGFRRGRSPHQAIGHVRQAVVEGYGWCAAIDLQQFFDEIPHGLILKLIGRRISDERLLTLIARALNAGVIIDGVFTKIGRGCPQGSPLSPMLSNIVLHELDRELESRGHRYSRWADDFLILLKSERAAKRVMESISGYLEEGLGLPVNREKSWVAPVRSVEFLGFQIFLGKIRVSQEARTRFKSKVREMTRRNNPLSVGQIIRELNAYLRGWIGYYRIQEFQRVFRELDGFIRSRLRAMQLKKWKKPRKFQRRMIWAGFTSEQARRTWIRMTKWQSVRRREARFVLNLTWFRRLGLFFLDDFTQQNLELGFNVTR
jgi:group II intron reverse transcriptase/maturase